MKRFLSCLLVLPLLLTAGCKKEKKFTEASYILSRWAAASRSIDYNAYRDCEANPKDQSVFREMFREKYYDSPVVTLIGSLDEDDVMKDPQGRPFIHREVSFECKEISRRTGKIMENVRGDVLFIRYTDAPRRNLGWLMLNRTMIRTGQK